MSEEEMKDMLEKQLCKIHEIEKELEYEKQKNFRRSDMIFDLLKENKSITENFISKDKIREFIKEELPDDEIMETCSNYDINGVKIREELERLLEE